MTLSTIAVTGGNGKIGRALLSHLNDHGYETVDIARGKRREEVSDSYLTTDLLDAGETYGALAKSDADAVVHMGTIPDPNRTPQFRTYESNVMSAAHVLEASEALGLEACSLASSINAMGAEHQTRDPRVDYLPVDESHPRTPDDSYGVAKHAMEVTADGFGRRPDCETTISTLRYPWVANDEEVVEYFVEADYTGHETFWAVAGDTTAAVPTATLAAEFYPEAEGRGSFEGTETLFDISKAADLLGWEPAVSWRDYRE